MKKLLVLTLLAAGMLPAYAQTSIGIIAGYNLNNQHIPHLETAYTDLNKKSSTLSWRAGVITEHHLAGKFFLQPQLILNNKGANYIATNPVNDYHAETKRRMLYLELQANALFKQPVGKGSFFAGAGPYIGRGIEGRDKTKGSQRAPNLFEFDAYYVIKYKSKIPTSEPNYSEAGVAYAKPIDAGVNFQVGYEFRKGLFFNAVYSLGLANIGYSKEYPVRNRYFGLSVGYYLKRFS